MNVFLDPGKNGGTFFLDIPLKTDRIRQSSFFLQIRFLPEYKVPSRSNGTAAAAVPRQNKKVTYKKISNQTCVKRGGALSWNTARNHNSSTALN